MKQKTIGILAGMGPRSTAPFLEMVYDQCQIQYGAKYDIDYPQIMVYSLPTPFYTDREIDHEHMKDIVIEGLQRLEATGVDFIAMPCNSAHIYFRELEKSINIPLLNIVNETINCLSSQKQRISVFATEGTMKSRIYQSGITAAGHEYIFSDHWQDGVNKVIQMIKIKEEKSEIIRYWGNMLEEIKGQSVDTLIFGCTDLSVLKEHSRGISILDSSEVLAKKTVTRWMENQQIKAQ